MKKFLGRTKAKVCTVLFAALLGACVFFAYSPSTENTLGANAAAERTNTRVRFSFPYADSFGPRRFSQEEAKQLVSRGWTYEEVVQLERTPLAAVRAREAALLGLVGPCLPTHEVFMFAENTKLFPVADFFLLCAEGLSLAEMKDIAQAYARYGDAYAFVKSPRSIPSGDAYVLATYVSIVSGGGVDPAVLLGIFTAETRRGTFLGTCRYFPQTADEQPVKSIPGEAEAFRAIMAGINSTRNSRAQMPLSHAVVSCPGEVGFGGGAGWAQMLPSVYLDYEPRVRAAIGETTFVSPYHLVPALHALAMYVRDHAELMGVPPRAISAGSSSCVVIAAKYYAGSRWKYHRGENGYGGKACAIGNPKIPRTVS